MQATTPEIPELAAIHDAARALAPYLIFTPLLRLDAPEVPGEIYLKLENLQSIGAYKVRTMGNILLHTAPEALREGVYTASSGNAGLALAWMAQHLGIPARVYATPDSPATKRAAIRACGAEVRLLDADEWWRIIDNRGHPEDPGCYIDAVRDPLALAGNATIGLEINEQLPDVDSVIVPFGGGGVACGIASAFRALKPDTRIVVAESTAATPATSALRAGRPVAVPVMPSFISGAGAPHVLAEMWPLVEQLIDATRVVPVAGVADAIRRLVGHNQIVAEGAGALSVAAALAEPEPGSKTVCVVTGGNIDADVLAAILRREI